MLSGRASALKHIHATCRGNPTAPALQQPLLRAGAMQPEGQVSALTAGDTVSAAASNRKS